jgi:hypothetical protein
VNYSLLFAPELEEDLHAGFVWYEDKSIGLGAEFLAIFYNHVDLLKRSPLIYPKVHSDFHRSLLRQFPFACYYRIEGDAVVVYGLFHCARNPNFVTVWLNSRNKGSL